MNLIDPYFRLKRKFTSSFVIADIAEPLISFDAEKDALGTLEIMRSRGAATAAVRTDGIVTGYVIDGDLRGGTCGDHLRKFNDDELLEEHASLSEGIGILDKDRHAFIRTIGAIDAMLARSDFEKPAARMWLFGMVTIIEMNITKGIELRFADNEWTGLLSPARLEKANELLTERQKYNSTANLLSCLQLADKGRIFMKDEELRKSTIYTSRSSGEKDVAKLERLRNSLAHSQDIVDDNWDAIVILASRLNRILDHFVSIHES